MMPYTEEYELSLLRGVEEERPWDIAAEVLQYADHEARMLDVGCGTCAKLRTVAPEMRVVFGLDPNPRMLKKASENVDAWQITNLFLLKGVAEQLPFPDNSLDVVTSMVSFHDAAEIARVLGPSGVTIVEKIGDRDKWNLKLAFGDDKDGPRGFLSELTEGSRVGLLKDDFDRYFNSVEIRNGEWQTYYSLEGFARLCEQVSLIRGFDRVRDAEILKRIERDFMTPKGIETTQQRILMIAKEPRAHVGS